MPRAFLLVCCWLFVTTAPVDAATLLHMGSEQAQGAVELRLSLDRATTHTHFTLAGPDRLVIDFADTRKVRELRDRRLHHDLVRGIRYGVRPDNALRVVIDLAGPARFLVDSPRGTPGIVRVTLAPRGSRAFVPADRSSPVSAGAQAHPPPVLASEGRFHSPIRLDPSLTSHRPRAADSAPLVVANVEPTGESAQGADSACGQEGHFDQETLFDTTCSYASAPDADDAMPHALAGDTQPPPGYQGSWGLLGFPAFTGDSGRRIDVGYRGRMDGNEIGVSLLRPAITWKSESDDGDVHVRVGSGELSVGIKRIW